MPNPPYGSKELESDLWEIYNKLINHDGTETPDEQYDLAMRVKDLAVDLYVKRTGRVSPGTCPHGYLITNKTTKASRNCWNSECRANG